jgi:uncharacterized protein
MTSKDIVDCTTILRATVGSTVHGLHHCGQDDRDEIAVFVEAPEFLLGLSRALRIRGGSTASSTMSSGHSPKWLRLALKGHSTILLLLFVPEEAILTCNELGEELRALRPTLLSRRAGRGYLGYLQGQKERMLGSRGPKGVNRPELVEAHGFDTKYAMHAARLGYPGSSCSRPAG